MPLPLEPVYTLGVELSAGSLTNVSTRVERASWDGSIVDLFRGVSPGKGFFELANDDGMFSPRSLSGLKPGRSVQFTATYGSALLFANSSGDVQHVESAASSLFESRSGCALAARVQVNSFWGGSGNGGFVEHMGSGDTSNVNKAIFLQGGLVNYLVVTGNGSFVTLTDASTPSLGRSAHYLGTTFAGSYSALYRDGVLVASTAVAVNSLQVSLGKVRVGALGSQPSTFRLAGAVDEVALFNRGLTPTEAGRFNDRLPTTEGLRAWWLFDEGSGTTAADSSGNGISLSTFTGSVAWRAGLYTYPLFYGRINDVSYSSALGNRKTLLECTDEWERVARLRYNTPIFINTNVASIFTSLMSQSSVRSFGVDALTDSVGFGWYADRPAGEALEEMVRSGGYTLYVDGAGTFYLRDRNWQLFADLVGPVTNFFDLRNRVGQDSIINQVKVKATPRKLVSNTTTMAFIPSAITLPASSGISFWLTYQDPEEPSEATPVASVFTPVSSTDYYASAAEDGTGSNLTSVVSVAFTSFAASAVCSIFNGGGTDGFLFRFQVRGFPLRRGPDYAVELNVNSSQNVHGLRPALIQTTLFQNPLLLDSLADYVIGAYYDPREEFKAVMVNEFPDVLRARIGNNFGFSEAFTGYSNTLRVHNLAHEVGLVSGLRHETSADLKSFDSSPFLILDDSTRGKLDDGRVLAV